MPGRMSPAPNTFIAPGEGPVAEVLNPAGTAPVCLVCEHASAAIPAALSDLGLAPEHRLSHAAWDIGALELARALSGALDAPLLVARVSRLVYDCNRPPEAPDAIPARTETIEIPGNRALDAAARAARVAEVHDPFRAMLAERLDAFERPPALVTVHSFTPSWFGTPRAVELGILHDADDRLALGLAAQAPAGIDTRLNEPYSAAQGVTHTLRAHALPRGLPNAMLEVRNDLLGTPEDIAHMSATLAEMLTRALARESAA